PPRRLPRRLDGRQEEREQDRDDGDHHQQFDQGEGGSIPTVHHSPTPTPSPSTIVPRPPRHTTPGPVRPPSCKKRADPCVSRAGDSRRSPAPAIEYTYLR